MTNRDKKNLSKKILRIALAVIICIGLIYFLLGFFSGSLLENGWISDIGSIGEVVVALAAALMIIYQLEQEKEIEQEENRIHEANFILQYNQIFLENENMQEAQNMLTNHYMGIETLTEVKVYENLQKFVNYLVYLEGLAPLILNGVINLENIDDLFAYRYFIAMNNSVLQKISLREYPQHYRGCYKIYRLWRDYRIHKYCDVRNENYTELVPLCETELDQLDKYRDYGDVPEYEKIKTKGLIEYMDLKKSQSYSIAKLLYDSKKDYYEKLFGNRMKAIEMISEALLNNDTPIFKTSNIVVLDIDEEIMGVGLFLREYNVKQHEECKCWLMNIGITNMVKEKDVDNYIHNLYFGTHHVGIDNAFTAKAIKDYTDILIKVMDREIKNVSGISTIKQ